MADVEVLIAGAGPTGLTLACELARAGVSFQIIETSPGPQAGSRGKSLQPRTLEVLDDLGVVERVIAHGRMAMPMRSADPEGRETLSDGEPQVPRPDAPYPASLITPEWRIEETLRARLAEFRGAVGFDSILTGFEQTADAVTATISEGSETRMVTARWLVGCDGGKSTVRRLAGIAFVGETREDLRMIVADVRADGIDRDHWHQWRHAEGFFALCPLPSTDLFQLQASIAPTQDPGLDLANMQAILERRTGRMDIRLQAPEWSSLWRANMRLVDRYRQGRALLAGDAAHVHSPAGGQGMNTGMQDAHNLGWKLAAVSRGAATTLIDTYQEERLPVAAGVLALSNELLQKAVQQRGIALVRDQRTQQIGIGYRESSLSRGERNESRAVQPGDRAPDAPGLLTAAGKRRLFELLRGPQFTVLLFGTGDAPAGSAAFPVRTFRVVQTLAAPGDVVDTAGYLVRAYAPTDGLAVLIRPDGYVALITTEADGVTAYFRDLEG